MRRRVKREYEVKRRVGWKKSGEGEQVGVTKVGGFDS